jgi:hypothetical protein
MGRYFKFLTKLEIAAGGISSFTAWLGEGEAGGASRSTGSSCVSRDTLIDDDDVDDDSEEDAEDEDVLPTPCTNDDNNEGGRLAGQAASQFPLNASFRRPSRRAGGGVTTMRELVGIGHGIRGRAWCSSLLSLSLAGSSALLSLKLSDGRKVANVIAREALTTFITKIRRIIIIASNFGSIGGFKTRAIACGLNKPESVYPNSFIFYKALITALWTTESIGVVIKLRGRAECDFFCPSFSFAHN